MNPANGTDYDVAPVAVPPQQRQPLAWRCAAADECRYTMLAMDHRGAPLPFEASADGRKLPMRCPACEREHTFWIAVTPFDDFGRHTSLPGPYAALNAPLLALRCEQLVEGRGNPAARQPASLASRMASDVGGAPARKSSYVCGKCGRRLLRMDPAGNMVPMETDPQGNVVPLECPGCNVEHTEWPIMPLNEKLRIPPKIVVPDVL
jgi:hypothetical protein